MDETQPSTPTYNTRFAEQMLDQDQAEEDS